MPSSVDELRNDIVGRLRHEEKHFSGKTHFVGGPDFVPPDHVGYIRLLDVN